MATPAQPRLIPPVTERPMLNNRSEFVNRRKEIVEFLRRKWAKESRLSAHQRALRV
jgi:nuclear transport factor 2 (NTF2) superfamily protein